MADQEQLDVLRQGVEQWNRWRVDHPQTRVDLRDADLRGGNFRYADLRGGNLIRTDLSGTDLREADLSGAILLGAILLGAYLLGADLSGADLWGAILRGADFREAILRGANFSKTDLTGTILSQANLSGANLNGATVGFTIFGNLDLRTVKGLEALRYTGPSTIGVDTLVRSQGDIPVEFLRGAGLPDSFIEYARSLIVKPIEYYTCFISYSSQDEAFIKRLYADLQEQHVRCWYAPEDLKPGNFFRHGIDEAIRLYDKFLLVLSEHSVESGWVGFEVEAALEKEQQSKCEVLLPIRLDNCIMTTSQAWAAGIRRQRHIGDFRRWKDYDAYQQAFTRLVRDLQRGTTQEKV